jgi:small-conductance mechanosensitive channel
MKIKAVLSLLVFGGLLATAAPGPAQEIPEQGQPQEAETPTGPPGVLQIAAHAQLLADSAAQAEGVIENLADIEGLTAEVEDSESRHRDLRALLASMIDADFVRLERLSRLRDQALLEDGRLEGVRSRLTDRLTELGEVHGEWTERREIWRSWVEALRAEADFGAIEPEMTAALQRIEEVLDAATVAASLPLALQGRVEALRGEIEQVSAAVAMIQARRRQALIERSEPFLFSREHRAQLRETGWRAWDPTAGIDPAAYRAFARENLGMLGFYALLAFFIGALARAGRLIAAREDAPEWSGLLENPWALGLFVSVVVAMVRITLAPPLWDVLLWAIFGVTAAILGRRAIEARAFRLMIYLLAAFYPAFLLLEVAGLPEPVFRVGLAAVAASAIPIFLRLARDAKPATQSDSSFSPEELRRTWPLRLGAGVWIGVLLFLIVGLDALARWTLHATVMSAAVAFTVMLGFILLGAGAATFSRLGRAGSLPRRAAVLLAHRMILILRVALVAVGGLLLLDIWGGTGSSVATWQRIMAAGFQVGTLRVTVGRMLLGAFVVYLAVLVSGLVRALVTKEPAPEGAAEEAGRLLHEGRGVAESITRLAHYAFVTLGVILALAVMGVELQNFAIVAGALGIGVGFGLQNVVNNFASGLILLFERPVRVGDTVVVGGVWGTIEKIGLRSTVMLTLDESEMIVPNGDLVAEKVINWTLTSPIARIFLPVGVAYGSPITKVMEVMEKAAFAHRAVLGDPPPQVLFMGFGDSSLDFELRVWVRDIRLRMEMRSTVLADIDHRLREAGIEIPFPQRDLHLRSIDREALKQLVDSRVP